MDQESNNSQHIIVMLIYFNATHPFDTRLAVCTAFDVNMGSVFFSLLKDCEPIYFISYHNNCD